MEHDDLDDADASPLRLVRERAAPAKARARPSRAEAGKSRFQRARDAERERERLATAETTTPSSSSRAEQEQAQDVKPEEAVVALTEADLAEVWLDADGAPMSAFKKAMLQRKGLRPPGGIKQGRRASTAVATASPSAPAPSDAASGEVSGFPQQAAEKVGASVATNGDTVPDELDGIAEENAAKVAAMTPAQVQDEVMELQEQLGADLLEQFRQLALSRAKAGSSREVSASAPAKKVAFDLPQATRADERSPPSPASASNSGEVVDGNGQDAPSALRFHDHADVPGAVESIIITQSGVVRSPSRVSASSSTSDSGTADNVDEVTYSLAMLLSLVQSSAAAQRQLGFTVLTRAMASPASSCALRSALGGTDSLVRNVLRTAALAARYTLADKHRSLASAARRCLLAVLSYLNRSGYLRQRLSRIARPRPRDSSSGSSSRNATALAAGAVGPVLANAEDGTAYPEDLQRDLVQSLPSSSAASLLLTELLQGGLVPALRAHLSGDHQLLSTHWTDFRKGRAQDVSASAREAAQAISETATILLVFAQASELHAETIVEESEHDSKGSAHGSATADVTLLGILIKHGLLDRRWPLDVDGREYLDIMPEVLSLVATLCNATPRSALKLGEQRFNIPGAILRCTGVSQSDLEASKSLSRRYWELSAGSLLTFIGFARFGVDHSVLNAYLLWVLTGPWITERGSTFAQPLHALADVDLDAEDASETASRCLEIRCASRVLALYTIWIEDAASPVGDFTNVVWPDVGPVREAALAILVQYCPASQSAAASSPEDQDAREAVSTSPRRSISTRRRRTIAESYHFFASATKLLTTWLQAAYESTRRLARTVIAELAADAALARACRLVSEQASSVLDDRDLNGKAPIADGEAKPPGQDNDECDETEELLEIAAHEVLVAIEELSSALATQRQASASPKDESTETPQWAQLARQARLVLSDRASEQYDASRLR